MTHTDNYNFNLPGGQDPPDIEVINQNMEIIDEKLYEVSNHVVAGNDLTEE